MMNYAAMDHKQVIRLTGFEVEQVHSKFTIDSFALEGVTAFKRHVDALEYILKAPYLAFHTLEKAVEDMTDGKAKIRDRRGMNVRVGDHTPPRGGTDLLLMLDQLLDEAADGVETPWDWKERFLWLHPFTDGNGRLARALWFRFEMLNNADHIYRRLSAIGLMKTMYLAQLESSNVRAKRWFMEACNGRIDTNFL